MGWQDRDYASEQGGYPRFSDSPFMWLLAGRTHLFRVWGVNVYMHSSLLVLSVLLLLFGSGLGLTPSGVVQLVVTLFVVILLHEFGHIWGARKTGGQGEEILMTPLGGLAFAQPAVGWYSHTVTIICGPLVNVLICLVAGGVLFALTGYWPLGPWTIVSESVREAVGVGWFNVASYVFFLYSVSYFLLLFNMLPIYPLDGGQFLQGVLWKFMGFFRATLVATGLGMIGGILLGLIGLASGSLMLALIGIFICFVRSLQVNRAVKAAGPGSFEDADNAGWRQSLNIDPDEPEKKSWKEKRLERKAQAQREREAAMRQRVEERLDFLLAKISDTGIGSLTAAERKELDQAREAKAALGDG